MRMKPSVISSRGQLVIPAELRRKFGLNQGETVFFVEKEGRLMIIKEEEIEIKTPK
jgi:AbrB family looped-hinge helix DNA binding protein